MQKNYWPTATWQAVDPENVKMDANKLSELEPKIKSEYSNINGIVVVRNGSIAYERYFHGYGPDDTYHVASVTKSILSALIGIAIHAGYISDVNQKVLAFFPEYVPDATDKQKQEITIRHLLTMTAPYPFADWHEPLDKLCQQADWVKYTLDMLGEQGEIGTFKYSTSGAHLLSTIMTRSTGKNARAFANEHLFSPIGMRTIPDYDMKSFGFEDLFGQNVKGWVEDPKGNATGGWGLTLTARDMARFGLLYLNGGQWDNQQIIPTSWISESTAMNPNNYGYLWWLKQEDGVSAYLALGDGGNVICCIPEKDLVIAIVSTFIMNPLDRWTLIKEQIMPAILE
ncbi:serine hydrolase domain-containing protein [Lysinibacillus sphaericus]|uniref:Beta-lactamase class C-like protein n=1 Tax=Lysinibacillus sphaericus OT4b.31 TaxID=1285586 RepID=R7ZEL7_LYSSH|nr:serine hydrolase [Lysinibacillus sphaericus]EON72469.1 beta-lactamase class C-like protein [Lysinibacillus sphaericus OT4b.31]